MISLGETNRELEKILSEGIFLTSVGELNEHLKNINPLWSEPIYFIFNPIVPSDYYKNLLSLFFESICTDISNIEDIIDQIELTPLEETLAPRDYQELQIYQFQKKLDELNNETIKSIVYEVFNFAYGFKQLTGHNLYDAIINNSLNLDLGITIKSKFFYIMLAFLLKVEELDLGRSSETIRTRR